MSDKDILKLELNKAITLVAEEMWMLEGEVMDMPLFAFWDVYVDIKNDEKDGD